MKQMHQEKVNSAWGSLLSSSRPGSILFPRSSCTFCGLSQTLSSEYLSLSYSSCFINATKTVLFNTISEKEPDPGSSNSQFQALSVSHTFLDCRKGLVLAYYPSVCHHILLGALSANLVLQCLPHQFFMPPVPDTIVFAQRMVQRRLGSSSS